MSERIIPVDGLYYQKLIEVQKVVKPGDEIVSSIFDLVPDILVLGNTRLKPDNFNIREQDKVPIGHLLYPGKSAMIDFLSLSSRDSITPGERDFVASKVLGKGSDRRDCLWHANLRQINNCGFHVYYAPVRNDLLHIRLVHKFHLNRENWGLDLPDYPKGIISNIWTRKRP